MNNETDKLCYAARWQRQHLHFDRFVFLLICAAIGLDGSVRRRVQAWNRWKMTIGIVCAMATDSAHHLLITRSRRIFNMINWCV